MSGLLNDSVNDSLFLHHRIDQLNAAYAAALDEKRFDGSSTGEIS